MKLWAVFVKQSCPERSAAPFRWPGKEWRNTAQIRKENVDFLDAGGSLLHDQIKLMCIAMHIMGILKLFTHLLLHTSLLSPHHTRTIVSLCNEFHLFVIVGQKLVQSLQKHTGNWNWRWIRDGNKLKKTFLHCMVVINVSKHKHQLCLRGDVRSFISLDRQIASWLDFLHNPFPCDRFPPFVGICFIIRGPSQQVGSLLFL